MLRPEAIRIKFALAEDSERKTKSFRDSFKMSHYSNECLRKYLNISSFNRILALWPIIVTSFFHFSTRLLQTGRYDHFAANWNHWLLIINQQSSELIPLVSELERISVLSYLSFTFSRSKCATAYQDLKSTGLTSCQCPPHRDGKCLRLKAKFTENPCIGKFLSLLSIFILVFPIQDTR